MDVEVEKNEIHLLISKGAMKQMGIFFDFTEDMLNLNGHDINLQCTSTRHYCVPVAQTSLDLTKVNVVLQILLDSFNIENKKERAVKLHKQFSHAKKGLALKTYSKKMLVILT